MSVIKHLSVLVLISTFLSSCDFRIGEKFIFETVFEDQHLENINLFVKCMDGQLCAPSDRFNSFENHKCVDGIKDYYNFLDSVKKKELCPNFKDKLEGILWHKTTSEVKKGLKPDGILLTHDSYLASEKFIEFARNLSQIGFMEKYLEAYDILSDIGPTTINLVERGLEDIDFNDKDNRLFVYVHYVIMESRTIALREYIVEDGK